MEPKCYVKVRYFQMHFEGVFPFELTEYSTSDGLLLCRPVFVRLTGCRHV